MKRICVAVCIFFALAALPAQAQDKDADKRGFVWNDRPSIVFGEDLSVDVTGRVLMEWRKFDPPIGEDLFHLRTMRIGLKGELTRHFDWEIEREITDQDTIPVGDWKDVYLEWTTFDALRVKGGRFKVPFGLEQNTGIGNLDFAYRALGSTALTPGRDRGVMVFGDLGRVNYEAGVFDDDGDIAESNEPQFVAQGADLESVGPSFAARLTGDLFRLLPVGRLQSAIVGVAYTTSQVPEGLNSLRGEGLWGDDFFERVYVQDAGYDAFPQKLAAAVAELEPKPGLEPGATQGPLIDDKAGVKVEEHIQDAVSRGAKVVVGGKRHALGGRFFEPTVLANVSSDALMAREETFGPVAPLFRFATEEEAVALANDTEFGLAAYFYGRDIGRVWRVAEALEAGIVGINTGLISTEVAPFGGVKESGLGREGSKYGIDEFVEIKYLCLGGI